MTRNEWRQAAKSEDGTISTIRVREVKDKTVPEFTYSELEQIYSSPYNTVSADERIIRNCIVLLCRRRCVSNCAPTAKQIS